MKIPSDEEIHHWVEINLSDWQDGASGAFWMRDQLKPLLDLVEQLREARMIYEISFEDPFRHTSEQAKLDLDKLRDKMELGE